MYSVFAIFQDISFTAEIKVVRNELKFMIVKHNREKTKRQLYCVVAADCLTLYLNPRSAFFSLACRVIAFYSTGVRFRRNSLKFSISIEFIVRLCAHMCLLFYEMFFSQPLWCIVFLHKFMWNFISVQIWMRSKIEEKKINHFPCIVPYDCQWHATVKTFACTYFGK